VKILVTGSAGHLGEALMRTLRGSAHQPIGVDVLPSPFTDRTGSIVDRSFVASVVAGVDAILHTATLHKPHVATRSRQDFVDVNVTGTLNLLEEAVAARVGAFVFTSTTSVFGDALSPDRDAPAAWITEDVVPIPKNIYGITKLAAEELCGLMHRQHGLPCLVLRTSRFFPEDDDLPERAAAHFDANLKLNELLYRRADIADVVDAHIVALERAPSIGFGRYIVSATTPFTRGDLRALRTDPSSVVARHVPDHLAQYASRGWTMLDDIDRVYVNEKARRELGWMPRHNFRSSIEALARDDAIGSELARVVGKKDYHRRE
jgi:UDP-glucose 4-epimerase